MGKLSFRNAREQQGTRPTFASFVVADCLSGATRPFRCKSWTIKSGYSSRTVETSLSQIDSARLMSDIDRAGPLTGLITTPHGLVSLFEMTNKPRHLKQWQRGLCFWSEAIS